MAPTDLSTIQLPDPCRDWARTADELTVITEHAITVNLTWWNESLQARGLQGGPAVGRDPAQQPIRQPQAQGGEQNPKNETEHSGLPLRKRSP